MHVGFILVQEHRVWSTVFFDFSWLKNSKRKDTLPKKLVNVNYTRAYSTI